MERNTAKYYLADPLDAFQYTAFLWRLKHLSDVDYFGPRFSKSGKLSKNTLSETIKKNLPNLSSWSTIIQYRQEWEPVIIKRRAAERAKKESEAAEKASKAPARVKQ